MPRKTQKILKFFIFSASLVIASVFSLIVMPQSAFAAPENNYNYCSATELMSRRPEPILQSRTLDCEENLSGCELAQVPQASEIVTLPTPTPKPKVKVATASATPVPTIAPTPELKPAAQADTTGLSADVLFEMINAHRATKNLPAYEKDARLCELAASRGPELHEEIYGSKYIHQGFRERNLPFWITENMISKESEAVAMRWWLNSSLHRAGIESDKKYACGACVGNSCAMLFTSWQEK